MTGNEYQEAALRTAPKELDNTQLLLNGLIGMNSEAGEALDILKKHLFQGHWLDRTATAKELGDVCWYLAIASHALGYQLDDIFQMNIDKLKKRYPDGFDAEKSINRKPGDT